MLPKGSPCWDLNSKKFEFKEQKPIGKQQLWFFDTFSTKKSNQVVWFYSTSFFWLLCFYFVLECSAIYLIEQQKGTTTEQFNGIPGYLVFI